MRREGWDRSTGRDAWGGEGWWAHLSGVLDRLALCMNLVHVRQPSQFGPGYLHERGCRISPIIPWTLVQGTIHTRTLKNKLPFPVHVAGVLDQKRPGRAFLRPTLSGDIPSSSLDYEKKRTGPPDHRTSLLEVATSSSSVRSAGADRG